MSQQFLVRVKLIHTWERNGSETLNRISVINANDMTEARGKARKEAIASITDEWCDVTLDWFDGSYCQTVEFGDVLSVKILEIDVKSIDGIFTI